MKLNRVLISLVFVLAFAFATTVSAASTVEPITLPSSQTFLWVKTKEWVQINLLTFKTASKASLYNGYADRRISEIQYANQTNNDEAIEKSLSRYEIQKQKSFEYAIKANDKGIMEKIRERTLAQQREMTQLQLKLDQNTKLQENIVNVQKQVASEIKNCVQVVEGTESAEKIEVQTWVVWRDPNADINGNLPAVADTATLEYAPGTSGAGTGGRVYQGGSGTVWAPGTSAGGSATTQTSGTVVNTNTTNNGTAGTSGDTTQGTVVEGNSASQQSGNSDASASGSSGSENGNSNR